MELDFKKLITNKSNLELHDYIKDRLKYNRDVVFAAIDELKKRGAHFSDDEIAKISFDLKQQEEISKKRVRESSLFLSKKQNFETKEKIVYPKSFLVVLIVLASILGFLLLVYFLGLMMVNEYSKGLHRKDLKPLESTMIVNLILLIFVLFLGRIVKKDQNEAPQYLPYSGN